MEKEEKELMEEKPKKRRKKNGHVVLNTFLIILLLVAFLGIGFAVGSTEVFKKISTTNSKGETVIKKGKNESENLSIFDEKVTEALKGFEQLGFEPEEKYTSNITNIKKNGLVITALKGLEYEQINFCKGSESELTIPITIDDLNTILKKVIPDGKITIDDIKNNANESTSYSIGGYGYTFKYPNGLKEEYSVIIKDNKIYVIGPCGHEGPYPTNLASQTEKAELNGDKLYVYKKVAFGKTEVEANNDSLVYEYYKDKDYKTKEEVKPMSEEPSWGLYDTYKITFKKNGDKFYFVSSELQK